MESTAASVSDDDQASPRSVVGGPAPSERSEGEEVAPREIAPRKSLLGGFVRGGVPRASRRNVARGARGDAKNFATAIMAAEGADVSLVGVLGPYRDARSAALTETYRGVVPYLGATRTRGAPLFLAVVAATSATTPEISELCLDLAARLRAARRRSERARRYAGTRTTMRSPTHTTRARARGDRGDGGGRRSRRTTRSARSTRGDDTRRRRRRRVARLRVHALAHRGGIQIAMRRPRRVRRERVPRAVYRVRSAAVAGGVRGGGGRGRAGGCHLSRDSPRGR